jgi:hypothetical protein
MKGLGGLMPEAVSANRLQLETNHGGEQITVDKTHTTLSSTAAIFRLLAMIHCPFL